MPSKKKTSTKKGRGASTPKSSTKKVLQLKGLKKRDGSVVPFDVEKVKVAVWKSMRAAKEGVESDAEMIARAVAKDLLGSLKKSGESEKDFIPTVEEVQDLVEKHLILNDFVKVAKGYILYRQQHTEIRNQVGEVPKEFRDAVTESRKYFNNPLSEYIYYSTYSKWIPDENRRETWVETIGRYNEFMRENLGDKLTVGEYKEIEEYMLGMKTLGSMRLLWGSGSAARKSNVVAYNCSFIAPSEWQDFGEIAYVLMCGSGLGYSVEHQNTEMLPMIKKQKGDKVHDFVIEDSKEGWGDAIIFGLTKWSQGEDVKFDYSKIRPQGARLVTMGGRASGPGPLRDFLNFARERMLGRQGRRLSTLDVHDLVCKIGEIVVMGGVRRSALISLSDLDDQKMREAKDGQFYINNPQRSMANNSAVYDEKPDAKEFLDEFHNLVKGQSGERGIFNRGGLKKQMPARRWPIFQQDADKSGLNPCGEIYLKSKQFCNLTEVVVRAEDTEDDLMNKVRVATILGTYQSTLTKFPYLSNEWKKNCEEERLLGVSMTGQYDCPALRNPSTMRKLKEVAIDTNRKYAKRFGVNESTAITCTKPSGNGSQLFGCASGCHPRFAQYYVRRVRVESHNPLFHMLRDAGIPHHPEVGQVDGQASTYVLEFPVASPEGAVLRKDVDALQHLNYWKMLKENFTEHNPSVTIQVKDEEWIEVANWVYKNWDIVGGVSFLPYSDHIYKLAPYEEITKEEYDEKMANFPNIDFSKVVLYEYEDRTTGSKELACSAGTCEVDIPASDLTKVESDSK